jgi:hypothetical protein
MDAKLCYTLSSSTLQNLCFPPRISQFQTDLSRNCPEHLQSDDMLPRISCPRRRSGQALSSRSQTQSSPLSINVQLAPLTCKCTLIAHHYCLIAGQSMLRSDELEPVPTSHSNLRETDSLLPTPCHLTGLCAPLRILSKQSAVARIPTFGTELSTVMRKQQSVKKIRGDSTLSRPQPLIINNRQG